MKRTGDYTLTIQKCWGESSDKHYKITTIEFQKTSTNRQGERQIYTYDIRTKSAHGDYYNLHIRTSEFILTNVKVTSQAKVWLKRRGRWAAVCSAAY